MFIQWLLNRVTNNFASYMKVEMASHLPEIPKQHKAVVYDKPGSISTKVVLLDTPEPGPGEALINL
jgi:hypothetical protein